MLKNVKIKKNFVININMFSDGNIESYTHLKHFTHTPIFNAHTARRPTNDKTYIDLEYFIY